MEYLTDLGDYDLYFEKDKDTFEGDPYPYTINVEFHENIVGRRDREILISQDDFNRLIMAIDEYDKAEDTDQSTDAQRWIEDILGI